MLCSSSNLMQSTIIILFTLYFLTLIESKLEILKSKTKNTLRKNFLKIFSVLQISNF